MSHLRTVFDLMNDFIRQHEEDPTRVYIPRAILNELVLELEGPMKEKVMALGWKALGDPPHLYGMLVIREGRDLRVERNEEDLRT